MKFLHRSKSRDDKTHATKRIIPPHRSKLSTEDNLKKKRNKKKLPSKFAISYHKVTEQNCKTFVESESTWNYHWNLLSEVETKIVYLIVIFNLHSLCLAGKILFRSRRRYFILSDKSSRVTMWSLLRCLGRMCRMHNNPTYTPRVPLYCV